MNLLIKEQFEKYYQSKGNWREYIERCSANSFLLESVVNFATGNNLKYQLVGGKENWPSMEWIFQYDTIRKSEFIVRHRSILLVSKIAPFYHLYHEFEVENKDDSAIEPVLDGFSCQPYIRIEQDLNDVVETSYKEYGYTSLNYSEMNEVVCGELFKKQPDIFGSQVTVEILFFHDFLELCKD
ncbi:hypothetical protein [Paenibacillus kobensis]|uniref:hypothetical protein n=1 Tax=Paenibacillus kobensis TaxID=59841 RepID=UPI000FD74604|nr:hypothetical protein [Paenibacillus kobensis]